MTKDSTNLHTRRFNGIAVDPDALALLFDCDGTLVDSMPLHMRAWEHATAGEGLPFDYDFLFSKRGMPEEAIASLYALHIQRTIDVSTLIAAKHKYFWDHMDLLAPLKSVVDVAVAYHGVLPMAVISGGTRDIVLHELRVVGIEHLFHAVLTADDPFPPKPAPDLFLEAARRLGVAPDRCLVFEDGEPGLEAARAGGMIAFDVRPFLAAMSG